ncbi:MAG: hypothetical protein LBL08_03695 [Candidatus Nomurabacteria bacterium]|jgi:hypothetical protein|nr:hypothetical protein [Candidatus Nomurabacteria bacterium]
MTPTHQEIRNFGLREYVKAARGTDFAGKLDRLLLSKQTIMDNLARLALPSLPHITLPISRFIDKPDAAFQALDAQPDAFYASLSHSKDNKPLLRKFALDKQQTVELAKTDSYDVDTIFIREEPTREYSGSVMVNDDQRSIHLEMCRGHLARLAHAGYVDYSLKRDAFLGSFKFNEEADQPTRQTMLRAIQAIPNPNTGQPNRELSRDCEYLPGYYEFLFSKIGSGALKLAFTEYNDVKPFYKLDPESSL